LSDPILRRRARHVRTESERVRLGAKALRDGELAEFGQLMIQSHRSLANDFEVSTSVLDTLVNDLTSQPGVLGARLTGAGFGGCVVALAQPGVELRGWLVTPSAGAHIELLE
jgi:galactokinase